jgi:hypothetical protein
LARPRGQILPPGEHGPGGPVSLRETDLRNIPGSKRAVKKVLRFEGRTVAFGAVAGLVGIECGVVSGVINLESSGVEASDWRPRHDEHYHEA